MNKKKICIGIVILVVITITCMSIFLLYRKQKDVSDTYTIPIIESNILTEETQDNVVAELELIENTDEETLQEPLTDEIYQTTEENTQKEQSIVVEPKTTTGQNSKTTTKNTKEKNTLITQPETIQQETQKQETVKQETTKQETTHQETTKQETVQQEIVQEEQTQIKQEIIQEENKEVEKEETNKIDLSKYDYYEASLNGTYKAFVKDTEEIAKLKSLINTCIGELGYTNAKVEDNADSSLARSGVRYFTTNITNVRNAIYDCDGFTISYYAEKEYHISADGKETFFQIRSYIKVK